MLSGGFFGDYELCVGDYCTSWAIVTETVGSATDAAIEATTDAGEFVYEAYDEAYFSGNGFSNFIDNFTWPMRKATEVGVAILGGGCARPSSNEPPAPGEYLRDINYNALAAGNDDDLSGQHMGGCVPRMNQESFDFFGYGVLDAKFCSDDRNWLERRLTHDDCWISAWRVYNPHGKAEVCGEDIQHIDNFWSWEDTPGGLDDDNPKVWLLIKAMERVADEHGIPGIVHWKPYLVEASQYFVDTAKLIRHHQDVRTDWLDLFKTPFKPDFVFQPTPEEQALADTMGRLPFELNDKFVALQNAQTEEERIRIQDEIRALMDNAVNLSVAMSRSEWTPVQRMELELFYEFAAAGVRKEHKTDEMIFSWIWRNIDVGGPERAPSPSHGSDWVTPLINAGSLYFQMVNVYMKHLEGLTNNEGTGKLDTGEWEVIEDADGELVLRMLDTLDPLTGIPVEMDLRTYANDFIWRKEGESVETLRSALIEEIDEAVERSKDRCNMCTEDHLWAKMLLEFIEKMKNGMPFEVWPRGGTPVNGEAMIRRRVHREAPHVTTAEECCNLNPPAFLDDTTGQCNTETNAFEWCYAMQPPRMFDEVNCACTQDAGAALCLNMMPRGVRIFVRDPETHTTGCESCPPETPITEDGLTCIARQVRTPRIRTNTTPPPPPPQVEAPVVEVVRNPFADK